MRGVWQQWEPQTDLVSFAEYCQTEILLELHLVLDSDVSKHQHILLLIKHQLKKCQLEMSPKLFFVELLLAIWGEPACLPAYVGENDCS